MAKQNDDANKHPYLLAVLEKMHEHLQLFQLPLVEFGGAEFLVDLRLQQFTEARNPFNHIPFTVLQETKTGVTFLYDPLRKCAFNSSQFELENRTDLVQVQLPSLRELDPVRFKQLRREEFRERKRKR
jgi:hypothetical protein